MAGAITSTRGWTSPSGQPTLRDGATMAMGRVDGCKVAYGQADRNGSIPSLIALAREKGTSAYIGDGANRWTGVHRLDADREAAARRVGH